MNPNQPSSNPNAYLDQIATQAQPPKRSGWIPKKLLIGGIIAIVTVIILAIVATAFGSSQRSAPQQLLARLNSTQTVVTDAQPELRNSQLRSLNSGLSIYFTNTLRDSADPFGAVGVSLTSLPGGVVENEARETTELTNRLEDARLNAVFDRTYALEMDYRLSTIMTLMQESYNKTSNEALRTFLDAAYDSLEPTQRAFADFNEGS